jgi:hypothetical protein
MLRSSVQFASAALLLLSVAAGAHAQLPVPRLNSIFPCGAKQGTTIEATVVGADMDGASELYFSHPGITAASAGANKFRISVSKDVPVGQYDVRVVAPLGLSNFRAFVVSDWPEVVEKEPNNEPGQAQRVTLPVVINGRIDKVTDVDHFVFAAKKGRRFFVNCWAWRIDSQLDGTLMLYDAHGKEMAYSGDYYGKDPFLDFTAPQDGDYIVKIWDFVYAGGSDYFYRLQIGSAPHIDAVVPAAVRPGEKATLTIYGRNLPGGRPAPERMTTREQPLEVVQREIQVPPGPGRANSLRGGEAIRPQQTVLDGMDFRLTTADGSSNPVFLGFTTDPVLIEQEPNDDQAHAQNLPIPSDVTGMFFPRGDRDYYAFTAKKGEKIVVEVYGERQSGIVDPFLTGLDKSGKRIFSGDDSGRNIGQIRFTTNTRDPRWDFTAPADGEYLVQVRDLYYQQRGEPRFTYRLSIRRPQPDFRLVVVPKHETQPDALVVGQGGNQWMDVLVFRNDGFEEPITVEAAQLPPGVTCAPVTIGPGKISVPLVFHAAKDAPIGHGGIRVTGKASIGNIEVVREARGGGLTWPTVNTPGIARLADSIVVAVRPPAPFTLAATPAKSVMQPGEKLPIEVRIDRAGDWADPVQLSGFDLPPNASVGLATVARGAAQGKVELTLPMNMKPGTYSFAIIGAGQVQRDYAREGDPKKRRGNNVRDVYPSNPITITVLPASAGRK